jgi:hypothetical protein
MMNREWEIKFKPGQIVFLDKDGTPCEVRIEGVSCHNATGWQVIYDVREIESKVAYSASQKNLSGKPARQPRKDPA